MKTKTLDTGITTKVVKNRIIVNSSKVDRYPLAFAPIGVKVERVAIPTRTQTINEWFNKFTPNAN